MIQSLALQIYQHVESHAFNIIYSSVPILLVLQQSSLFNSLLYKPSSPLPRLRDIPNHGPEPRWKT